jgi:uncharacterized protein (TIGR02594 family)
MADLTSEFLALTLDFASCPWMAYAAQEAQAGIREGRKAGLGNPRINEYLRTVGLSDDETPWCSAFVNWCVQQAGLTGTNRGNARSWLHWGGPIVDCRLGAVAVFRRGTNPAKGHVAFYAGDQGSEVLVLGGNQGNAVCVRGYARGRLLGFRWPMG